MGASYQASADITMTVISIVNDKSQGEGRKRGCWLLAFGCWLLAFDRPVLLKCRRRSYFLIFMLQQAKENDLRKAHGEEREALPTDT
jgi:hypothetical protein